MPERRQFEGKDLRDALRTASAALGIPEDRLAYEVLASSRKGVFGFGTRVQIWAGPAGDETRDEPSALERSFELTPPIGEESAHAPAPASTEDVAWARARLAEIVELMDFELELAARATPNDITLELTGADRERLLQDDGELLEALQFLLNRIAKRRRPDSPRIRLECAGFREERDQDLITLARDTAQQVALSGRARWLPALNPYERRLVHLTVGNIPGVATESAGDGFLKRVRILPTKQPGEA
jgi:spoIIIJ-associated protein